MLKPAKQRHCAQHNEHEQNASDVEGSDQPEQGAERCQAVAADGERHGAESADGRESHQDIDYAEHRVRQGAEQIDDHLRALAHDGQRESEQDGEQQHLQDVAFREGIDHRVRDDVHQEVGHALRFGLTGVLGHGFGIERGGIDVESGCLASPRSRRSGR